MFQNDFRAVTAAIDAVLRKKFERKVAQAFTPSESKFSTLSNKLKIKVALLKSAELEQLELSNSVN